MKHSSHRRHFAQPLLFLCRFLIFGVLLPLCVPEASALEFEKVLPFATADQVRVEATVTSEVPLTDIEIDAEIIQANSGQTLWTGPIKTLSLPARSSVSFSHIVSTRRPEQWSPSTPVLYTLKLIAREGGKILTNQSVRFGFRTFESKKGQFFLNDHPIFLRGVAINPPGRTIPWEVGEIRVFAESYVRYMKRQNVNAIRLTHDSQVWFDVCDELGMLVFQGQYGSPLESPSHKMAPPRDVAHSISKYKKLFETYVRHPSICIYILSNELPYTGQRGTAFHDYLTEVYRELQPWDPTRLYIGNAGYGEGREGDICDVHRYWGWYYNSFLTYYNLRNKALFGDVSKNQPITFTECVGNFTGPSGEFNIVRSKQLGAQLNWTGHSPDQREDALRYQSFMVKQATESFRRLRPLNKRLSGIMPFSIFFYNWSGIKSFEEMLPKPALDQLRTSYQPVLVSWELWTSQVYAGTTIEPVVHVINDADDFSSLPAGTFSFNLYDRHGVLIWGNEVPAPKVEYYQNWNKRLKIELPKNLPTGTYRLAGRLISDSRLVSTNEISIFIAGSEWGVANGMSDQKIDLYDPAGQTGKALDKLGISFRRVRDLKTWDASKHSLVIGEKAWREQIPPTLAKLKTFIQDGGRILCLQQNPEMFQTNWLPEEIAFCQGSANDVTYPPKHRPFRENMNINLECPGHPVFKGLERQKFELWSDYSGWNETKTGFPQLYPVTTGFRLHHSESLARTAILANYDRGLEGVALCEMFAGKGSVVLSGFDLVNRSGLDPVADRFLLNLVQFIGGLEGHEAHPLITEPIQWGNYATEKGLITGPLNGLVENTVLNGDLLASLQKKKELSWNTHPGDQFISRGRNPMGPYGFSKGTSLLDLNRNSKTGSGIFWARISPGKKVMVTEVLNPDEIAGELSLSINGISNDSVTIPPGETRILETPFSSSVEDVAVHYTGPKTLVILTTEFK